MRRPPADTIVIRGTRAKRSDSDFKPIGKVAANGYGTQNYLYLSIFSVFRMPIIVQNEPENCIFIDPAKMSNAEELL